MHSYRVFFFKPPVLFSSRFFFTLGFAQNVHIAIFFRCIRSFSVGLCCHISDSILRRSSRGIVLVIVHVNHARVKALLAASPIFDHSSKIFETEAETVPNPLRNQRSWLTSFDTVPLVCLCVCVWGGGPNPRRRTEYASGYGPPGTISASVFGPAGPYPLADLVRPDHIWGGPNPLWHRLHRAPVINTKFLPQPYQKYYITQYEELDFPYLTQIKDDYTRNSHCVTHTFLFKRRR